MNKKLKLLFAAVYGLFFCAPSFAQTVKQDSLDLKIGQMIMLGIGNTTKLEADDLILKSIAAGHVGGILLYEKNLTKKNTAKNLKKLLKSYKRKASIPLLISIDEEGGIVNRLKPKYGFPETVTAKYLGDLNILDSTKHYSDLIAHNLYKLGINVNYAPVLDVHDPDNPAIGRNKRSFSEDPVMVTNHARTVIKSHRYFGVKTVLKHFPGQGNATKDSHFDVTDVSTTWQEKELLPYIKLIYEGNADAIMTAHIVNAKLDPEKVPATLSKEIITGLLREKIGFEGVVFSDDMQMKAISDHFGFEKAIKMAISAGVDILMFSNHMYSQYDKLIEPSNIIRIIKEMIKKNELTEAQIDASYKRIMKFKKGL